MDIRKPFLIVLLAFLTSGCFLSTMSWHFPHAYEYFRGTHKPYQHPKGHYYYHGIADYYHHELCVVRDAGGNIYRRHGKNACHRAMSACQATWLTHHLIWGYTSHQDGCKRI